jgi:hypothetical protein
MQAQHTNEIRDCNALLDTTNKQHEKEVKSLNDLHAKLINENQSAHAVE